MDSRGPHTPVDYCGQDYKMGGGDSPAVNHSIGGGILLRGQLDGTDQGTQFTCATWQCMWSSMCRRLHTTPSQTVW